MTKIESVDLPGRPSGLVAASPAGPVYVVCRSEDGAVVHAVDLYGRRTWSRPLAMIDGVGLRTAPDGGLWSADDSALVETMPSGSKGRRVALACARDEHLGSFVVVPDGFIVAWTTRPYRQARVEYLDASGRNRWSTILPEANLSHEGVVQVTLGSGEPARRMRPWRPRDYRVDGSAGLLVSEDRVLVTYYDYSSGISVGYGIDLGTGALVWVTPPHPSGRQAIEGPGRFLVGAQGYGAFSTWLYDRDGAVVAEWPSHGELVVSGQGEIRVIETDNANTLTRRVRRLHLDGSMTDGPVLPGFRTSRPVLSGDGRCAFWRGGALHIVDQALRVQTGSQVAGECSGRMLLMDGGRLFFVLTGEWAGGGSALVMADTDLTSPPAPQGTGAHSTS